MSFPPAGDQPPTPESPPNPSAAPKIAIGLTLAVVLAAAGTVVALRGSGGGALDTVVPTDAAMFVELNLRPGGSQRAAIDQLLGRMSADERTDLNGAIDQAMETLFSAADLAWSDVKRWVGTRVGIAMTSLSAETFVAGPDPVVLISVRDEAAARAALSGALVSNGAFEVEDGVAFVAERAESITAFRDAARAGALADNSAYAAARADHGDVLAFAWGDAGGLAALGGQVLPGGTAQATTLSFAVRAEPGAIVLEGGAPAGPGASSGGSLGILDSSSAGLLGALSLYDLGSGIEASVVNPALRQVPGLTDALEVLDSIALDIERDLAPWTKGELSVIVGGFSAAPIPDLALAVEVTDEASLDRFLSKVRAGARRLGEALGIGLEAAGERDAFTIGAEGVGAFVRRAPGRLVIGSSTTYAEQVLSGAADPLGDDVVYRRALGGTAGDAVFQLYVRIDRIKDLVLAFTGSEPRAAYEAGPGPLIELFESLIVRATADGAFRVALTAKP